MTRVLLVRHGRSTSNAQGTLAGRTPGVALDAVGIAQVSELADRLAAVRITHLVSSPLQRTMETAKIIAKSQPGPSKPKVRREPELLECDYGKWSGKKLKRLANDPLWPVVQAHPSAVTFPGGESMLGAATRAIGACRFWAHTGHKQAGSDAVVVIVSHADIIKAVLADALGMHLDMFQRIVIEPASVSIVNYTPLRPFVELVNGAPSSLSSLSTARGSDAVVGGGAGRSRKKK
ncbi:MAG: MSMEG_4193 family putative phosphomutase [Actinobacteria bacterium]|nr:MSMEG_4193 family putative phosphomutase [Actinomycetota bacterium]